MIYLFLLTGLGRSWHIAVMFEESPMPKKPKKPIPDSLLSIDATAETTGLDHLEMAKLNLMARHEADQRFAVSVKEDVGHGEVPV
jgi:hypothetical protein